MRWLRHLAAEIRVRHRFPHDALAAIGRAVADGERRHAGEVCFAIEPSMPWRDLARRRSPRERAHDVFALLRVWDTEQNSGVLVYVLLADRAIEIVADRGIARRVPQQAWQAICDRMRERFRAGEYERGAIEGVGAVSDILAREFPAGERGSDNELPDSPVVL